jgi:hypothetical protein
MFLRIMLLILIVINASACTVGPEKIARDTSLDVSPPSGVGVALAGGGTKAASYAMGVLAAIADTDKGFEQIKSISSVSGGGYAAFYLYSKMLLRDSNQSETKTTVKDYFNDCMPDIYGNVLPHPYNGAAPVCSSAVKEKFRFQQFVRCRQDVLENDCKQQLGHHDYDEYENSSINTAGLLTATVFTFAPNLITGTIFDWPVNLSPTRNAYLQGIGTAYGLYPRNASALAETSNIITTCNDANFLNCDKSSEYAQLRREGLGFGDLRTLMQKSNGTLPIWYINATASKGRSLFRWALNGKRDFTKYTLQMSPYGAYSGFYGMIPDYDKQLDLLEGVTAAAAFFDPNEIAARQPWRMGLAVVQHLAAFDWGQDITNPNVYPSWRAVHNFMPIPTYYLDGALRYLAGSNDYQHSVYIRLIDGGNNDDLGAYTLIEAGMKHIVISDHAQDGKKEKVKGGSQEILAKMVDLCLLHNEIALRSAEKGEPRKLLIPSLENFEEHCHEFLRESECTNETCKATVKQNNSRLDEGGYPILEWKYPVVLGCITSFDDALGECNKEKDVRVYLLKPALDLQTFVGKYLPPDAAGKNKVTKEACPENNSGVCEVAAYIADWYNTHGKGSTLHPFPQDGTVKVTFASSGKIYGAYRELARSQMREALEMIKLPAKDYGQKITDQSKSKIRRILTEKNVVEKYKLEEVIGASLRE